MRKFLEGVFMTEENFIEKLSDILCTDVVLNLDTELSKIEEWDSLSVVSFGALVNVETGKKADVKKINAAKTVKDSFDMVK